ncbi:MAG: tyrosine-type recombinase/integrase [Chitinispirillia bacterium]|jgi:site-specific recombinase XerD
MPITDFFCCKSKLERYSNCGILSSYIDTYTDWLATNGFAGDKIRRHISNIAHFSNYLNTIPHATINNLPDYFSSFLYTHIPNCTCHGWRKRKRINQVSYSLNRFKQFLLDHHEIDVETDFSAYSIIHKEYLLWLSENYELVKSTVEERSRYLRKFLEWYSHESGLDNLKELRTYDVERFYIESTRHYSKSYKRSLQATLRSFFNFCYIKGYTPEDLQYSLPKIRTYQLSEVPKGIEDSEAVKLLKSIDRTKDNGIRLYAILQLLFTYGVRVGQIISLKLTDINWYKEEIHFPALKNGKSSLVPLTVDTGNALVDYLEKVRGTSLHKEVFLTLHAPISPMKNSNVIYKAIRAAMQTLDIWKPGRGTHCFRYCFVARMLKQGETFKNIADLIGHKHIQSTFIYTKIDFKSLAEVALELPEVDNENS